MIVLNNGTYVKIGSHTPELTDDVCNLHYTLMEVTGFVSNVFWNEPCRKVYKLTFNLFPEDKNCETTVMGTYPMIRAWLYKRAQDGIHTLKPFEASQMDQHMDDWIMKAENPEAWDAKHHGKE